MAKHHVIAFVTSVIVVVPACGGSDGTTMLDASGTADAGSVDATRADAARGHDAGEAHVDAGGMPSDGGRVLATCGDGRIDPGEACDGRELAGFSCSGAFAGFRGGTLACRTDCRGFDLGGCIRGGAVSASSCAIADVSAAIDRAAEGDTVTVPAGTCTWDHGLIVQKGIVLRGAGERGGAGGTTIVNGAGGTLVRLQPEHDQPIRLTGFRFDQQNHEYAYVVLLTGLATHLRVDHCAFETGDWAIAWNPFLSAYGGITGTVNGVVDHCSFHNMKRAIDPGDVRASDRGHDDGATAWTEPMRPGTVQNMYVEDCTFTYDAAYPVDSYTNRGDATVYASSEGGSIVLRHSTFTGYNANYLDAHGDVGGADTARLYEVYANRFVRGTSGGGGVGYVGNARGGSWLVWDNVIEGFAGETFRLWNYCAVNGHPVRDTYFWGNSVTPGPLVVSDDQHNSACPTAPEPVRDRDYFLHAPEPGQTFYPYAPYVYPHPLVVAE